MSMIKMTRQMMRRMMSRICLEKTTSFDIITSVYCQQIVEPEQLLFCFETFEWKNHHREHVFPRKHLFLISRCFNMTSSENTELPHLGLISWNSFSQFGLWRFFSQLGLLSLLKLIHDADRSRGAQSRGARCQQLLCRSQLANAACRMMQNEWYRYQRDMREKNK